jgi:predicted lipoprotein
MRRLTLCLLTAAFCGSLHAADRPEVSAQRELFRHWAADVMLPLTQEFAAAAGKLSGTAQAFCAGQRELRDVQAAWRDAQSAWQPLEMLQLGPAIERRTQRQVNFWPVRPKLLEPLLADTASIDPERIDTLGASGKGFPALEYLLFPVDKTNANPRKHCHVVQALAAHVKAEAQGLATDWRGQDGGDGGFARQLTEAGRHPQNSPFASADQALSDVVNLLIAGLDALKSRKVGKPLEKSSDGASLERIESWRAGTSLDHIRDNLRGFELLFFGPGKDGFGLDDYLARIERPGLARVIRGELDAAQKALSAIRPPMQNAVVTQRRQVEQLHQSLGRLQYLMETEVADALKVDLGFNTSDGD